MRLNRCENRARGWQVRGEWGLYPVNPAAFAWAYMGMGKKDETLAWLDKAYARHSNIMDTLKVDPAWDPLRSDPRFQTLVRRVGLAQ